MFSRPLSDRIHRPLAVAVVWAWLVLLIAAAIVGLVSMIGWGVSWVASLLGDVAAGFPVDLATATAATLSPFAIATTAYAASYASAERNAILHALGGTVAGLAALIVLARAGRPIAVFGALAVAWVFAAPFDAGSRALLRLVVPTGFIAAGLWIEATSWLQVVLIGLLSPPIAAITVWLGDMAWIWLRPGLGPPAGSEGEHREDEERRGQHRPL